MREWFERVCRVWSGWMARLRRNGGLEPRQEFQVMLFRDERGEPHFVEDLYWLGLVGHCLLKIASTVPPIDYEDWLLVQGLDPYRVKVAMDVAREPQAQDLAKQYGTVKAVLLCGLSRAERARFLATVDVARLPFDHFVALIQEPSQV